ncbi:MAG TPA: gentisate 1,2-dioxygenase [Xanthobacteraceae bacterium]|nr:gentisate 1,2-dioxygenase [Xanthobacteraceae bacterium]
MAVSTAEKSATRRAPGPKDNVEAIRRAYYDRIAVYDMAPLWEVMKNLVINEPRSKCAPAIWHYKDVRPLIAEAGELITAKEAERRVLVLENPALRGQSRATSTLFAGLQLIMPGEIAPAHRHTASAIRFVLDGEGAYTAVEGEKTVMKPGDFVITANWAAHDHGNTSDKPMVWLDVLDLPTVNFFETMFAEHLDEEAQSTGREDGDSMARYGSGVLPDGAVASTRQTPIINYPYARTRPILERLKRAGEIDKRHGARVRYANPVNGGWALPTMGAHLSLLPKGFKGESHRSTDGSIFVCVEGKGTTKLDDKTLEWSPGDVFVVPSWKRHAHAASAEAVLFGISDRPVQEALGIWREGN